MISWLFWTRLRDSLPIGERIYYTEKNSLNQGEAERTKEKEESEFYKLVCNIWKWYRCKVECDENNTSFCDGFKI